MQDISRAGRDVLGVDRGEVFNIGSQEEISIRALADRVRETR